MGEATRQKTKLEMAQREMRSKERITDSVWSPLFFDKHERPNEAFGRLSPAVNWPAEGAGEGVCVEK
jgi:hypothetical protein